MVNGFAGYGDSLVIVGFMYLVHARVPKSGGYRKRDDILPYHSLEIMQGLKLVVEI
jgi:hypothetical protein